MAICKSPAAVGAACALLSLFLLAPDFRRESSGLSAAGAEERSAGGRSTDWPVYNGSPTGDHYSPLSQINRANVKNLHVAWQFDTGETGGLETNPLVVNGTLYAYTPTQKIIALDAATGKLRWTFDSGIRGTQPARGVAYWSEDGRGRILAGVMNFLYALDAATGKPMPEFGEDGRIDLRKGLREELGADYRVQSIALTSPGIIYKDLIIVGGRNPETHPSPPGDIRAYDVRTGILRWRFHTIPHPGESGYETWPKDAWKYSGAANNWAGMALDEERGIVYVPTGSAVSDFTGLDRIGNDLFADTLLALDAATGKRVWHFQGVHHDIWDRDLPSPPALVTVTRDGKHVDAVAQTTKQGFLFLFDRATGAPIFPIVERAFPPSDVPGEVASATQPVPEMPEPFARQQLTEEMLTERTPSAHAWALAEFRRFRNAGAYVPFALNRQTIIFPGFDGGGEWGGPAVDPHTAVLYVNSNDVAWTGGLVERRAFESVGETIYQNRCSTCHGADRSGSPPEFPSLVDILQRRSADEIEDLMRRGKGRMPAFPGLSEDQLDATVLYLKDGGDKIAERSDREEMAPVNVSPETPAGDSAGYAVYLANCAACHGEHMEGQTPEYPSLRDAPQLLSRAQAVDRIVHGSGRMPGFPQLHGAELTALLAYIGFDTNVLSAVATSKRDSAPRSKPLSSNSDPMRWADDYDTANSRYRFAGYRKFLDPDGYPAIVPPWGTLNAIDLNTGRFLWKVPLGEYPALAAEGNSKTGSENYGGPIVTAGGLVFIGATVFDSKFRAFNSETGELLWEAQLPFPAIATPATYTAGGKQYVVIACGGGKNPKAPSGGVYVAFTVN